MKIGDYEVSPYATLGGGLLGAGLGLGAYALSANKTKKKLATYAAIGAALGLGTGALTSLESYEKGGKDGKEGKDGKDSKGSANDVKLNPINMGFKTTPTLLGGATGYTTSRLARELSAYRGAIPKSDIRALTGGNKAVKDLAKQLLREQRVHDQVRGNNWLTSALGLGSGGWKKMLGRGAVDAGSTAAGAAAFNLANNAIDWI